MSRQDGPGRPGTGLRDWRVEALAIFLILGAAVFTPLYLLYLTETSADLEKIKREEVNALNLSRTLIDTEIGAVVSDTRYLAGLWALRHWIGSGDRAARRALAEDYLAFTAEKPVYGQVRFLDIDGQEIVRIQRTDDSAEIVPVDRLQDKYERDYVRDIRNLDKGEVYVSRFDLNVEHGAIVQPNEPVLRFGMLVFDAANRRRGMVVVNFLGRRLFDRLRALGAGAASERPWFVNADGYWLQGPSAADEWAFLFPEHEGGSFAQTYPSVWTRLTQGTPDGQFEDEQAIWTYSQVTVAPLRDSTQAQVADPRHWYMVTKLPQDRIQARRYALGQDYLPAFSVLATIIAALSVIVARFRMQRQTARVQLQESEAHFRSLLEAAPDGVVISDREGRITQVNAATERLFGARRDDLLGISIETLLPEKVRKRHVGHRAAFYRNSQTRPMGANMSLRARRFDGTEFPVMISLSPVPDGEEMTVFSSIRDISEWQETQQTISDLNKQLASENAALTSANQELEAFSYSVSHDLRAPLRSIDGFSQALLEDYSTVLEDEGRDYLDRVRAAAQRMGKLIDDMLELSRVSRSELKVATVDLSRLAREVADALQASAADRKARIKIANDIAASGDVGLLRILLHNLIDNAWKYTNKCDVAVIEFGRRQELGETVYYVRDNGAGFDMAYADNLFRAFHRLHDDPAYAGTGIGLATAARVINKHGGRIWAEAQTDRGATFCFTLQPGNSQ